MIIAVLGSGHDVVLSATTFAHAAKAAEATGARAAISNSEAVTGADLVVLAVPHPAVAGIADDLRDALAGPVVVDTTNPLNDTYTDLTTNGPPLPRSCSAFCRPQRW